MDRNRSACLGVRPRVTTAPGHHVPSSPDHSPRNDHENRGSPTAKNTAHLGNRLLIDDGKVGLIVTQVHGNDILCTVTEGGPVSNNKGLSLPGMNVSVPALSEKDIADLTFALSLGVDLIALSFVRSPDDVKLVHQVMDDAGAARIPVIAKLENPRP